MHCGALSSTTTKHRARHQAPFRFTGSTNVQHKPCQVCSTLDGFGSCDFQVFAEAKSSIQPLCSPQTFIDPQLQDSDVFSSTHDKCVIREADDARSSRQAQEIVMHDVPNKWSYSRTLRSATCHLFCERPFVALIYHPPVAQIVIYHPQQVDWNLLLHHLLDADIPSCGIIRISYVNADQGANSLTLTSSFSCICGNVNHSLDSVYSGPAFS